jgi:hypothetical protein
MIKNRNSVKMNFSNKKGRLAQSRPEKRLPISMSYRIYKKQPFYKTWRTNYVMQGTREIYATGYGKGNYRRSIELLQYTEEKARRTFLV